MDSPWRIFVHNATTRTADDPHVALLRTTLDGGARVVRLGLAGSAAREYLVVLERSRELFEQRIPHSLAFTRWSLEAGARVATPDQEAERFAWVLADRFTPLDSDATPFHWNSVFRQRMAELEPPRVHAVLADRPVAHAGTGPAFLHALATLNAVLLETARDLVVALRYPEAVAADLEDDALARYANRRFGLTSPRAPTAER